MVVDRARFSYSRRVNNFALANLQNRTTVYCALPKLLANLIGLMLDGNPRTSPDQKRMEVRHG